MVDLSLVPPPHAERKPQAKRVVGLLEVVV